MKYFYSHLISIETIGTKMDELEMTNDQKKHLAELIDSTIHHEILDLVLSQLKEEEKIVFLQMIRDNPEDDKLLDFLNNKVDKIEDQIKETAKKLVQEIHEDIEEAKKNG